MRSFDIYLIGLGITSLVLGIIGLLLFFMPILGIPISSSGLLFGAIAFVLALFVGGRALRCSLQGIAICALALSVNIAILVAPRGYLSSPNVPQPWQPVPERVYVPSPADLNE